MTYLKLLDKVLYFVLDNWAVVQQPFVECSYVYEKQKIVIKLQTRQPHLPDRIAGVAIFLGSKVDVFNLINPFSTVTRQCRSLHTLSNASTPTS